MKLTKSVLKYIFRIFIVIAAVVVAYVMYVVLSYSRIDDHIKLTPSGYPLLNVLPVDGEYTIVTQNCGFGAYSPDFTFFMDGGTQSWANDKETVIYDIDCAADTAASFSPDFILFQEVDTDSTRSYHVDQREQLAIHFMDYAEVFAVNYHSAFLMYPFTQPHGASNAGIQTFSRAKITSAERRQIEISEGLSKFLDLDRCYSVSRIPVSDGKEMVLYNIHSSAYGGSDAIRSSQMTQLFNDMLSEYEKGNYCVCGGDFNHDFTGNSARVLGIKEGSDFGWAQPFPIDLLPEGISRCIDYDNPELIPTARNCDIPAGPDSQTFVLDGYLVSDNVEVTELHNIDTGFAYSDHNPVVMKFVFKQG
ncbi:MAG: endonuclease/exonuclease/phosphatase family protein [Lachnospiraceae bacterium]|nr:endonuclease/exonuclease/phosphatase family protein [Lachnospiraceae bacterium]